MEGTITIIAWLLGAMLFFQVLAWLFLSWMLGEMHATIARGNIYFLRWHEQWLELIQRQGGGVDPADFDDDDFEDEKETARWN